MSKAVRVLSVLAILAVATTAQAQKAAIGSWDFTAVSPVGETKSVLVIKEEGGALTAIVKGAQGERPLDKVAVDGAKITLVLTVTYEGSPMVITYTGTIEEGKMGGEADFGGLATGTWNATAQK
jgi:hypothetical protein